MLISRVEKQFLELNLLPIVQLVGSLVTILFYQFKMTTPIPHFVYYFVDFKPQCGSLLEIHSLSASSLPDQGMCKCFAILSLIGFILENRCLSQDRFKCKDYPDQSDSGFYFRILSQIFLQHESNTHLLPLSSLSNVNMQDKEEDHNKRARI